MLTVCMLISLLVLLIYNRWKKRDIYKLGRELNSGVRTLPFLGHSYLFIGSNETRMKALQTLGVDALKNENGCTSFWLGNYLYMMVAEPVAAEIILKQSLEKDDLMFKMKVFFDNGSIFAPVSIWKSLRKVLVHLFTANNMKHFFSLFVNQSKVLVDQLSEIAGTGTISIWKYLTAYSMDTVAEASLGYAMQAQKDSAHPFIDAFEDGMRYCAERVLSPWLHSDLVYHNLPLYKKLSQQKQYLWGFLKKLIQSKRIQMEERNMNGKCDSDGSSAKNVKSFLELLITATEGLKVLSDIEIIGELLVLMIAGSDTTAVVSSFASVMLSRHPEVQDKVYKELQEVFGDSERAVTSEDLVRLKYLDAVIRETLRLYSPVPVILRKVEKEMVLPSGLKVVPGIGVMINIWAMHRNPRYWGDDAEQFRPERFIDTPLKHPAAFMPFSFGPRNCVGYQFGMISLKILLSSVLRRYKILPADNLHDSCHSPLRLEYDITMKDVDNFKVKLEYRNKI